MATKKLLRDWDITCYAQKTCVVASYHSLSGLLKKHRNVGKNTLLSINAYYSIRRD